MLDDLRLEKQFGLQLELESLCDEFLECSDVRVKGRLKLKYPDGISPKKKPRDEPDSGLLEDLHPFDFEDRDPEASGPGREALREEQQFLE